MSQVPASQGYAWFEYAMGELWILISYLRHLTLGRSN